MRAAAAAIAAWEEEHNNTPRTTTTAVWQNWAAPTAAATGGTRWPPPPHTDPRRYPLDTSAWQDGRNLIASAYHFTAHELSALIFCEWCGHCDWDGFTECLSCRQPCLGHSDDGHAEQPLWIIFMASTPLHSRALLAVKPYCWHRGKGTLVRKADAAWLLPTDYPQYKQGMIQLQNAAAVAPRARHGDSRYRGNSRSVARAPSRRGDRDRDRSGWTPPPWSSAPAATADAQ